MRLFLESRKIIIYRKKRKNRLMPCKPSRERKNFARVAFDMPATDPTYDVTFSTDDELCGDHSNKTSNCLQPPSHKMLLQSELQRRYIDEIGDNSRLGKGEPPELIGASLKRQNETGRHGLLLSQTYKPPTTAPTRADYKFPHLSPGRDYMSLRRTSSWHDVNNEEAKRLPKRHPASPTRGSKDDLHTRLSLKKKIWTGVPADSTNYFESNRTAFWGNSQTAALRAGLRSGNAATAHSKAKKMEEHEAFTNTCPEKIMALKEVSTLLNSDAMPARDRMTLNIVVPEINIEQRTLHVFQQLSKLSRESLGCHSTSLQAQGRQLRRKKNPMTETTQLLGRLYKPGKSRSNISMQRLKSRNTPCRATPMRLVPELRQCNNQQRPRLKLPPSDKTSRTKFRTNGLMATTVQSSNVRRSKLLSAYKAPSQLTEPMTAIVARNRTSNQQVTASSASTSTQPAETTKRNLKQWKPTTRVQPAAKQEDEVATAAPPTRRTQTNASERIPEGKKRIRDILH